METSYATGIVRGERRASTTIEGAYIQHGICLVPHRLAVIGRVIQIVEGLCYVPLAVMLNPFFVVC